ncbi:hypothetical protein [Streptomyces hilarionis]|uniref:hypothetical protein n=1 Tax=Streptomyces hilarionis TaxID=2839954 RepID=UPI00211A4920|nr:hypothetical protein [Streptomyces hilarionis]MCQ9132652.1 hypothetical protein [Streptomyces hilarionis]
MSVRHLPLRKTHDNDGSGFTRIPEPTDRGGAPSGSLIFTWNDREKNYSVTAFGEIFASRHSINGTLEKTESQMAGYINTLREAWLKFIEFENPSGNPKRPSYTFSDKCDLSSDADREHMRSMGKRLCYRGYRLFDQVFSRDGDRLQEIRERLEAAHRKGPCILTFQSDDLFVPWSMLYVPLDPETNMEGEEFAWSMHEFLGYRHWIEHQFRANTGKTEIRVNGGLHVGLNADTRIDDHRQTGQKLVASLKRQLTEATPHITFRYKRPKLATDLSQPDFSDQLMCFCCHAKVSGTPSGPHLGEPSIELSDIDDPIYTGDFEAWLANRKLPNTIVFIDACQAGQLNSTFYRSFSVVLLEKGANCLIGPQVDLPIPFACEYTKRFFDEFLIPGTRIGDLVRELTQYFAEDHHNPLGLIFSLYRGLDTRLVSGDGNS